MSVMKLRKISKELVEKEVLTLHLKKWIIQHQHLRQMKMYFPSFLHYCVFFWSMCLPTFFDAVRKPQANKCLVRACLQNYRK